MITAHGVPVSDFTRVLPAIQSFIDKVTQDQGDQSTQQIFERLWNQSLLLLVMRDGDEYTGAATLERDGDTCIVVTCGGHSMAETHRPLLDLIESVAKEYDLKEIEIRGRKGWERALRNDGYTAKYTAVSKRICA